MGVRGSCGVKYYGYIRPDWVGFPLSPWGSGWCTRVGRRHGRMLATCSVPPLASILWEWSARGVAPGAHLHDCHSLLSHTLAHG